MNPSHKKILLAAALALPLLAGAELAGAAYQFQIPLPTGSAAAAAAASGASDYTNLAGCPAGLQVAWVDHSWHAVPGNLPAPSSIGSANPWVAEAYLTGGAYNVAGYYHVEISSSWAGSASWPAGSNYAAALDVPFSVGLRFELDSAQVVALGMAHWAHAGVAGQGLYLAMTNAGLYVFGTTAYTDLSFSTPASAAQVEAALVAGLGTNSSAGTQRAKAWVQDALTAGITPPTHMPVTTSVGADLRELELDPERLLNPALPGTFSLYTTYSAGFVTSPRAPGDVSWSDAPVPVTCDVPGAAIMGPS